MLIAHIVVLFNDANIGWVTIYCSIFDQHEVTSWVTSLLESSQPWNLKSAIKFLSL